VGALLARFVPDVRLVPGAPPQKLSNDKEAIAAHVNDPLVSVANIRSKVGRCRLIPG